MTVHVLRTWTAETRNSRIWIAFTANATVRGKFGESKLKVLVRFEKLHGKITKVVKYTGVQRPSEAAMTIGSIRTI